jgi:hypothetical protein
MVHCRPCLKSIFETGKKEYNSITVYCFVVTIFSAIFNMKKVLQFFQKAFLCFYGYKKRQLCLRGAELTTRFLQRNKALTVLLIKQKGDVFTSE